MGVSQTVVEITVELEGIWQMARPEKIKMGKDGPEYSPVEKDPRSQLRTFTLPGAAQDPCEAIEIRILDKETGNRSNSSESRCKLGNAGGFSGR